MFGLAVGIVLSQALMHLFIEEICKIQNKPFNKGCVLWIWALVAALLLTIF
jgi:hypothetical protein